MVNNKAQLLFENNIHNKFILINDTSVCVCVCQVISRLVDIYMYAPLTKNKKGEKIIR